MAGPARTGVLIYAKDAEKLTQFYVKVLAARVLHADNDHKVLSTADVQLIVHAIPPHIAETFEVPVPPVPREEQAIKPFFTVESLNTAEGAAVECGGLVCGPVWPGPGFDARNVCDPEGNILHLRQMKG